jgi:transposase
VTTVASPYRYKIDPTLVVELRRAGVHPNEIAARLGGSMAGVYRTLRRFAPNLIRESERRNERPYELGSDIQFHSFVEHWADRVHPAPPPPNAAPGIRLCQLMAGR